MSFSHRDRRMHRWLWRSLGLAAGGSVLLGAFALAGPTVELELAGLLGLAALGGATMALGDRAVTEYERDLRAVQAGEDSSGLLRAEVRSDVGLERAVGLPSARSPNSRRASGRPWSDSTAP